MERKEKASSKCAFPAHNDRILSECLKQMFSTADENQAIDTLLRFIGLTFDCDRVYIFENKDADKVCNTYEWCASGIAPQKNLLQNAPSAGVAFWFEMFDKEGSLCIPDIESIRQTFPLTYAILKPQDIHSLIAGPIPGKKHYVGFIGADNPNKQRVNQLSDLLRVIGYFVSVLLKRRDLTDKLKKQSFFDPMTGALNRAALDNFFSSHIDSHSIGLVYGDISGLKQVNDAYGHAAGDELIMECYRQLSTSMEGDPVFRIGGDEFVVVCLDLTQTEFNHKVEKLKQVIAFEAYHLAIGSVWTDVLPSSFDGLLKLADKEMYEDKEAYYNSCEPHVKQNRDRRKNSNAKPLRFSYDTLPALMANKRGCYLCIGDRMGKRYFISDGLKKKFGFSSNRVDDFWDQWEERIVNNDHKLLFRRLIEETLREKKTHIDFAFDMQDLHGNVVLSRGSGLIQWDETFSEPILFMSCVQIDETAYLIDPVTGFSVGRNAFDALKSIEKPSDALLFRLNAFEKINSTKGIGFSNHLIGQIAEQLRNHFRDKETVNFYRIRDTNFMAVFSQPRQPHQQLVNTISNIVSQVYDINQIAEDMPVTFLPIKQLLGDRQVPTSLEDITTLFTNFGAVTNPTLSQNNYLSDLKQEIGMVSALTRDVHNDMTHFRVVAQPIVCSRTHKIRFVEVLLRWSFNNEEVLPSIFIPILERENLMKIAGKWLLEQAVLYCRSLAVYRSDISVTFNVSCRQILGTDFGQTIRNELEKFGVSGNCIIVELTQTHEDKAPTDLQRFIDACDENGIRIVLDDFGNEYRTLGLLLKYSAQIIKLDRSLLQTMHASKEKFQLVRSLVRSCHKIGKTVCIVGVETAQELALAKDTGCDWIQGFYFYKPIPISELLEVIARDSLSH